MSTTENTELQVGVNPFTGEQAQALANITGIADNGSRFVTDLTSASQSYSSAKPLDEIDRAILFNAISSPEKRLSDCINMKIKIKDVYCEPVLLEQEKGGKEWCPRIVLIDIDGVGYQSVSKGVWGSMKNLIQLVGEPTYDLGVPIVVLQETKGQNKILKFSLDIVEMKKIKAEAEKSEAKKN
jgi:hypothetical protein